MNEINGDGKNNLIVHRKYNTKIEYEGAIDCTLKLAK